MKLPFDIAALLAVPVLAACCIAPTFFAGLAASSLGWLAGFTILEIAGVALGATVLAMAAMRLWKARTSPRTQSKERIVNE